MQIKDFKLSVNLDDIYINKSSLDDTIISSDNVVKNKALYDKFIDVDDNINKKYTELLDKNNSL